MDRLVSIHRSDTESTHGTSVARKRRGDGGFFRTEKLRTAIETTDRNSASVIVPVAFGISSAMCLGLTDSQVD